ncbi:MAG: flavin reductase [Gemmatimonadota bacterium]|nr:flavin reductase [Gemmatimonadota bacterium]
MSERIFDLVPLDPGAGSIWERVYTVAPLVVVGTRERDGWDLAPKHLALPIDRERLFGFVCTPRHATYRNAVREGAFTVSYPRPDQVVLASLAASPRCGEGEAEKPIVEALPTLPATEVDGIHLADSTLFLECELVRTIDDLGDSSLVVGRVVVARADPAALRESERDDAALLRERPLLAYLPPDRYAEIRDSRAFPFPADFRR